MRNLVTASVLALSLGIGTAWAQGGLPSNPTPGSPAAKNEPGKPDGGGFGNAGQGGSGAIHDSARGRVNPTKAECDAGWASSMPWSQSEFRAACQNK